MYEEKTDNGFDEEDEKKKMDNKIEDHSITFAFTSPSDVRITREVRLRFLKELVVQPNFLFLLLPIPSSSDKETKGVFPSKDFAHKRSSWSSRRINNDMTSLSLSLF